MQIHLWGTRGSIAVAGPDTVKYGGNTTCAEIRLNDGTIIIIDAGTGIRALGERLLKEEGPLKVHLLVTHIHWDHILGFPFFSPIYQSSTRIMVNGSNRASMGIKSVFETDMRDGFFPVRFSDLKSRIEFSEELEHQPMEIGSAVVESIGLQHPHGGLGFKIIEEGKSLIFLTDNELTSEGWEGRKTKDFIKFCRYADLLIHDCQYTPEEINCRRWWGHSDYMSVLDMAHQAEVKRILLTHHDHSHTDGIMDEFMERCHEEAAKMGITAELDAAKEKTYFI